MAPAPKHEIVYADTRCLVATLGPLVVPIVGPLGFDLAAVEGQATAILAHGKRCGAGRMVELSIVDAEVDVPSSEERAALDRHAPLIAPYYAAVGAVFAGSGFRAAVVRGVIASFQLLSRTSYPQKVFATVTEALPFLVERVTPLGFAADAASLASGLRAIAADAVARSVLTPAAVDLAFDGKRAA